MAEPVAPHVLVIPYPSQGHMLPLLDLVHLLSSRARLAVTIVVTTNNQPLLDPLLSRSPSVAPLVLPFPDYPALPPGLENAKDLPHAFFRPLLHALAASKTPSSAGLAPLPTPPPPSSPTTCSAGPPTSPPSWTFPTSSSPPPVPSPSPSSTCSGAGCPKDRILTTPIAPSPCRKSPIPLFYPGASSPFSTGPMLEENRSRSS